ncbi:uncharacterized protein KQ657_004219 [Scheffersomyces spartinae]|uniref:Thioredoxin-like fold domain-containing protein n=1 Tax=Scheffersomyces spartinae TaxID=45513 RepID=A0A9P7VC00_9ASCO|nr:uncharacterized protein KQ657_004219 [Scheffersomyces spartinae]KAG7195102.1 hypothetical protein KQ657_004219 [Scheffersomyces spartinae]
MISPKYALTHYYYGAKTLATSIPNIVNIYVDYNCPFSAKLYVKLVDEVIPQLQVKHPNKFQFVYVNVIQPWHPNSNMLNEYGLAVAKFLREGPRSDVDASSIFWNVSKILYENKEKFYDEATVSLTRNQTYAYIAKVVNEKLPQLPFTESQVLELLDIKPSDTPSNSGNGVIGDVKYFTKYLRGVGVHVTPTISINGITTNIESGWSIDELVKYFESQI